MKERRSTPPEVIKTVKRLLPGGERREIDKIVSAFASAVRLYEAIGKVTYGERTQR